MIMKFVFVLWAFSTIILKNKKTSVAADHHSAGAETPIVFCVEVPQDPLVPGDNDDLEAGDDYDDDSDEYQRIFLNPSTVIIK